MARGPPKTKSTLKSPWVRRMGPTPHTQSTALDPRNSTSAAKHKHLWRSNTCPRRVHDKETGDAGHGSFGHTVHVTERQPWWSSVPCDIVACSRGGRGIAVRERQIQSGKIAKNCANLPKPQGATLLHRRLRMLLCLCVRKGKGHKHTKWTSKKDLRKNCGKIAKNCEIANIAKIADLVL